MFYKAILESKLLEIAWSDLDELSENVNFLKQVKQDKAESSIRSGVISCACFCLHQ